MLSAIIISIGLWGSHAGPTKFVEKVQELQVEAEYSPPVGRAAPPPPGPFTSVRYQTPDQRLTPTVVEPAAESMVSENRKEQRAAPAGTSNSTAFAGEAKQILQTTPSYITSVPQDFSGSATGSSAVAVYGD